MQFMQLLFSAFRFWLWIHKSKQFHFVTATLSATKLHILSVPTSFPLISVLCKIMFAKKQMTRLRNSTTDLLKVWLFSTLISGGWCFSSSVPPTLSVCRDMKPGHQPHKLRSDISPFTVSTDITTVQSGEDVIVTLRGDKENKFLGFYIQGRDEQNNIIGTFTPNDNVKVHNCAGMRNNAAHHANGKIEKENVKITWKAPKSFQGSVLFLATFVKEYDTFWTKVKSNELVSVTENTDQE